MAAIIGAAMLISSASGAQDDWVQLPSKSASDSAPPSQPDSQGAAAVSGHPQRGDDNAAVTMVEYSDFQCPFCREADASVHQVLEKYGDQVRLVYMDFPMPSHKHAMDAAIAARCADEQGQFWAYHDALFGNPSELSTDALKTTAAQLGLDSATFDTCLDERKYESAVEADRTQGEAAGLRGIPYFIIGDHHMDGAQPPAALEAAIDEELRNR